MIINHNLPAMNSNRHLNGNNNSLSKSLEKLSSGLRINKAGDDAAGLAISEKMRAQIRGLDMATKNAQDGVSLIQTAEGSLQSIEDILQRLRELADESATDTNVNKDDREAIQLEVNALTAEIDRIAKQSEFNTQSLLDGTFKDKVFHIGANQSQNIKVDIEAMSTDALRLNATYSTSYNSVSVITGYCVTIGGSAVAGTTVYSTTVSAYAALTSAAADGSMTKASVDAAVMVEHYSNVAGTAINGADILGRAMTGSVGGHLNLATQANANEAITTINNAINTVSMQRAKLGAIQNRLEYSIENLEVNSENTSAAESRIRDVNMAKEMTNYTKFNILAQSATAMLAQANQTPQNVLQLLR